MTKYLYSIVTPSESYFSFTQNEYEAIGTVAKMNNFTLNDLDSSLTRINDDVKITRRHGVHLGFEQEMLLKYGYNIFTKFLGITIYWHNTNNTVIVYDKNEDTYSAVIKGVEISIGKIETITEWYQIQNIINNRVRR